MAKKKEVKKKKAVKKKLPPKKTLRQTKGAEPGQSAHGKKQVKSKVKANIKDGKVSAKVEISLSENDYVKRIKQLEKEVAILREVSEVTAQDFDLKKTLDRFLVNVMDATDTEAGSLLLVDKISDTLYFAVAKGSKASQIMNYRVQIGEGIAGWVAQTGMPLITPDVEKDKRFNPKISKAIRYKTRNILCVPLKFEDEVLGVIELLNKKRNEAFDEKDLEILSTFLPYISVIIKNAQLFIENKKRIERLEHLMELTKFVNSTLNLDALLSSMLEISTEMLGAEAGSILLLDDDKDELVFAASTGTKKEKLKNIRVPVGEGIAGWVAREDESVVVMDAQDDPRFFRKADERTKFRTKTIIAVPLKTKQRLVGVVEVLNKKDGSSFNEEDKVLLEALANQAAIALENAKLYSDLKDMFLNTVKSLAAAIDTKDAYTRGHSDGVTKYSVAIAKELGFPHSEIEDLRLAAMFHDIGKIGIEESILRKPSKLTKTEYEEIKKHPDFAANILETIPQLSSLIPVIRHHHERYDGHGYPMGLKGDAIPFHSRIISIADTFDAMTTDRPYRKALPLSVAFEEIKSCAGTQFDPSITLVAINAIKKYFKNNTKSIKRRK